MRKSKFNESQIAAILKGLKPGWRCPSSSSLIHWAK